VPIDPIRHDGSIARVPADDALTLHVHGGVEVILVDVLLGAVAGGDEGRRRYTDICAKVTGRTRRGGRAMER
jgi:hypothetical protein